jgi:hypothetical protein
MEEVVAELEVDAGVIVLGAREDDEDQPQQYACGDEQNPALP